MVDYRRTTVDTWFHPGLPQELYTTLSQEPSLEYLSVEGIEATTAPLKRDLITQEILHYNDHTTEERWKVLHSWLLLTTF